MTPAPASDAASAPYASYGSQEVPYGDVTSYGGYDATYYGTGEHAAGTFAADPSSGACRARTPRRPPGPPASGRPRAGHRALRRLRLPAGRVRDRRPGRDRLDHGRAADGGDPQQGGSPETGQWDASAWLQPDHAEQPADPTQQWNWGTQTFDSGVYDATQWNSDGGETPAPDAQYGGEPYGQEQFGTQEDFAAHENFAAQEDFTRESFSREPYEQDAPDQPYAEDAYRGEPGPDEPGAGEPADTGELPAVSLLDEQEEVTPAPRAASVPGPAPAAAPRPSAPRC